MSFQKSLFRFFGRFILSRKHVCLIRTCFEEVGDSLLRCLVVFGKEPSVGPSFLLRLEISLIGCLFCSCSSNVFVSACLVFFGFWFALFQLPSLSWAFFLHCSVLIYFMSWLLVFPCGFLGCLFLGTLLGVVWAWARNGRIYFSPFLIIGVFGSKHALLSRARVFLLLRCFRRMYLRGRK